MEEFHLPLKIINLERRKDRKQQTIEEFKKHGISISDTHFFKAVDGKQLKITEELYELFKGNCFNYRGGVIGCALSHYYLWNQLITDNTTDYYLIMEDDCTLDTNFKRIVYQYDDLFKNNSEPNLFYMSYLQKIKYTTEPKKFVFKKFSDYNFIGGTQLYAINKCCAEELLNSIKIRGIKREIDWITSDATFGINIYELEDHIAFSDYVKNVHLRTVDSDIQYNNESLDLDENFLKKQFYFYENVDQIGNDLYNHPYCNNFFTTAKTNKSVLKHIEFLKIKKYTNQLLLKALDDDNVVAVNHLGYFKNKIDKLDDLENNDDSNSKGIYVKKMYSYFNPECIRARTQIKVMYVNFWDNIQNFCWMSEYIKNNISSNCVVVSNSKKTDILVASCFGDIKKAQEIKCKCKIFFYGENLNRFHPYNNHELLKSTFDLIVGFKETNISEKLVRLPLWVCYYPFYVFDENHNILNYLQDSHDKYINSGIKKNVASLVATHDNNGIRRLIYKEVKNHVDVLCPSKLLNNVSPIGNTSSDKIQFISETRFNICPENSEFENYYTEKIFESLEAGCIPFYWAIDKPEQKILNDNCYCWIDPNNLEQTRERILNTINNYDEINKNKLFKQTAYHEIKLLYETLKNEIKRKLNIPSNSE